jgi:hypothetical protein
MHYYYFTIQTDYNIIMTLGWKQREVLEQREISMSCKPLINIILFIIEFFFFVIIHFYSFNRRRRWKRKSFGTASSELWFSPDLNFRKWTLEIGQGTESKRTSYKLISQCFHFPAFGFISTSVFSKIYSSSFFFLGIISMFGFILSCWS